MTTLVTGGTGFIGAALAQALRAEGEPVRALGQVRNEVEAERAKALREVGAELVEGSITEPDVVGAAVDGARVVVHLAAAQHEANVPDAHFHAVNVEGTRALLEASARAGVARFVHGSTIGVYGWQPGRTVDEAAPLEPDNIYGRTKLLGEQVVRSFAERLPVTIARISETYGPGDRRLLKLFRGVARGAFLLVGPGTNLHHPIYVDDLVRALRLAAEAPGAVGATTVLVGPEAVTTREMAEAAARALGVRPPRLRVPLAPLLWAAAGMEAALRPLGIQPPLHRRRMDFFRKSFRFSGHEARERLGFVPEVGLDEGMARTAGWYREQGLLPTPAAAGR